MKTNIELVNQLLQYAEQGNMNAMAEYMTEDFKFSGATPQPMNKNQFIDLMTSLTQAIPDWKFNVGTITETGDTVHLVNNITGKNTGALNFPTLGLNKVPATNRTISLPKETIDAVIRNGQICEFRVVSTPGGGLMGIFRQLGVKLPATAGTR